MVSLQWDEEAARKFYESEARAEGQEQERISSIRNLMETVGWTAQQAMEALKIPAAEQGRYAALI